MSCVNPSPPACGSAPNCCPDCYGCTPYICADFKIKRYDTKPAFRISVTENDEPIDLTGLVIEANMWANAKLKLPIGPTDTALAFAQNVGFCQILVGDVLIMEQVRSPEQMIITGFDEANSLVLVQRGVNGTTPQSWKKGSPIKIFRIMSGAALSEMIYDDSILPDGTPVCHVLNQSDLVYEWNMNDTCAPGCFSFEFKVLKMAAPPVVVMPQTPCSIGFGVEWVRRYPTCGSFIVQICNTPTAEYLMPQVVVQPNTVNVDLGEVTPAGIPLVGPAFPLENQLPTHTLEEATADLPINELPL
jgi:hypothetical protein